MSARNRTGSGFAPLLLRLMLGVTFIWAGLGKLMARDEVQGETAAILANMGVIKPATGPAPTAPTKPLPAPDKPAEKPAASPAEKPAEKPGDHPPGSTGNGHADAPRTGNLRQVAYVPQQSTPPATPPSTPPAAAPAGAPGPYTAADFPTPVTVKRLHMIAAMLYADAHPVATPEHPSPMPLWPAALAGGKLPVIFAYLVTAAELGGGLFVLLGLCTRIGAFSLALVMAGAMWLSQIGPALQSGKTVLGFLPDHPTFGGEWSTLLWQFALFASALAILFSGPGYLAADHALFGGGRASDDHDNE